MFIQTEETPNPLTLKFLPGQDISPGASREFTTAVEAALHGLRRTRDQVGAERSRAARTHVP